MESNGNEDEREEKDEDEEQQQPIEPPPGFPHVQAFVKLPAGFEKMALAHGLEKVDSQHAIVPPRATPPLKQPSAHGGPVQKQPPQKKAPGQNQAQVEQDLYVQMMERLGRIEQGRAEANRVDEEEWEEYPLLAGTSVMHYFSAPSSREDFPGYAERLEQWKVWNYQGFERHAFNQYSSLFNFVEILNIISEHRRREQGQVDFTELVFRTTLDNKHVIGYWYQGADRHKTLDLLCSRTRNGKVLTRKPHPDIPFHHDYAELSDAKSRLHLAEKNGGIPVIFMMDFAPRDIQIVAAKFLKSRIVGITVPGPAAEAEITKILGARNKVREQLSKK